jgi:hypothetical protein
MPGRQHSDGTTPAVKAWYAHFLLPRPTFGPDERTVFSAALADQLCRRVLADRPGG